MKFILFLALALGLQFQLAAQTKFLTRTATISFHSRAKIENIDAVHHSVTAATDLEKGLIQFNVNMKGFQFEKALMQEHFNENYVESDKYPNASFKGSFTPNADLTAGKDGSYPVEISGALTIHGVTRNIAARGTFTRSGSSLKGVSDFTVQLSDYKISIPAVVKDNLSNTISIHVDARF